MSQRARAYEYDVSYRIFLFLFLECWALIFYSFFTYWAEGVWFNILDLYHVNKLLFNSFLLVEWRSTIRHCFFDLCPLTNLFSHLNFGYLCLLFRISDLEFRILYFPPAPWTLPPVSCVFHPASSILLPATPSCLQNQRSSLQSQEAQRR